LKDIGTEFKERHRDTPGFRTLESDGAWTEHHYQHNIIDINAGYHDNTIKKNTKTRITKRNGDDDDDDDISSPSHHITFTYLYDIRIGRLAQVPASSGFTITTLGTNFGLEDFLLFHHFPSPFPFYPPSHLPHIVFLSTTTTSLTLNGFNCS